MGVLSIVLTGIVATGVMTIFMNTCSLITRRNMYTLRILAQMLPTFFKTPLPKAPKPSKRAAISLHYGIGIIFATFYYLLRISDGYIGSDSLFEPWIIGVIYGIIAVAGWTIFVRLHPAPLTTVPWPTYLVCIFAAHIIFAIIMVLIFRWGTTIHF